MTNHDDFLDEYIEYRIFEESMKNSGGSNSRKPKKGSGCGTTAVIIVLVIIVLAVFGSCSKTNQKPYSSGSYKRSYSTSSSSYLFILLLYRIYVAQSVLAESSTKITACLT